MAKFKVNTKGKRGFFERDLFFPLRMNVHSFVKKFGQPDFSLDGLERLEYYGDGISVSAPQGKVEGITFYFEDIDFRPKQGSRAYRSEQVYQDHNPLELRHYRAADVVTDTGIWRGMSFREVVLRAGQPDDVQPFNENSRTLYYKFGEIWFVGNTLTSVLVGED